MKVLFPFQKATERENTDPLLRTGMQLGDSMALAQEEPELSPQESRAAPPDVSRDAAESAAHLPASRALALTHVGLAAGPRPALSPNAHRCPPP